MLSAYCILDLHHAITAIRSVSGEEGPLADYLEELLQRNGIPVARLGHSLLATLGEGPMLMFDAQLDTVPPVSGWTRDPWRVRRWTGESLGWDRTTPRRRSRR